MRHGKSGWDLPCSDFDRPLAKRGKEESKLMGSHLSQLKLFPDFVRCSSAKRTQETFEYLCSDWSHDFNIEYLENLYHAPSDELIRVARACPDESECQIIIAHNPGMGQIQLDLKLSLDGHMPTAACIVLKLDIKKWDDFELKSIQTHSILKPSELFR